MVASPLCWSRNSLISSNASPSLLAHHLTAAGETEHAVNQWLKAGRHAAARLAHVEAISHFERDLATLAALPEDPVRDGLEIELQLARGSSLFTAHGFNATDAGNVYARARELAERRGDSHQLFMAVYGLWQSAAGSGKILDCHRLSSRLQQLIADGHNDELLLQAHHSAWTTGRAVGGKAYRRPRQRSSMALTGGLPKAWGALWTCHMASRIISAGE